MNYTVHELPGPSGMQPEEFHLINQALLTRIVVLEKNKLSDLKNSDKQPFCIEQLQHDDKLVQFYTGFSSFGIFLAYFQLPGPAVDHLNYWGSNDSVRKCHRLRKLKIDVKNQLFLVLVKFKLNLKHKDLAFRFGISVTQVSRYITTWICLLHKELKEIEWISSVALVFAQVFGTQPMEFREKFPTTYATIDGSEVFQLETPSDLHFQSSTWSQYKHHHNTVKFLVACTPNGAIFYISPGFRKFGAGNIVLSKSNLTCNAAHAHL